MAAEISFKLYLHAKPQAHSLRKVGPVTRTFTIKVTPDCTFARMSRTIREQILPHDPPSSWTMWIEGTDYQLKLTHTWNDVPVLADQRILHLMV